MSILTTLENPVRSLFGQAPLISPTTNLGTNTAAPVSNGNIDYNQQIELGKTGNAGTSTATGDPATSPTNSTGGSSTTPSYTQTTANAQLANLLGSTNQAAQSQIGVLGPQDQQTLLSLQQNQNKINTDASNNELNKINATNGVNQLVGRGIQNAGTLLAGMNAGNSSAAQEFARQYGLLGRQQLSSVGNQYNQQQNQINTEQQNQGISQQGALLALQANKQNAVNNIVSQATYQLQQIQANMANAGLPQQIDLAQQQNQIKAQAMQQLSALDDQLNQGLQGIQPTSQSQNIATAQANANAGVAPPTAFDYTTNPGALQATGPSASSLPLYTLAGATKKDNSQG